MAMLLQHIQLSRRRTGIGTEGVCIKHSLPDHLHTHQVNNQVWKRELCQQTTGDMLVRFLDFFIFWLYFFPLLLNLCLCLCHFCQLGGKKPTHTHANTNTQCDKHCLWAFVRDGVIVRRRERRRERERRGGGIFVNGSVVWRASETRHSGEACVWTLIKHNIWWQGAGLTWYH